MTKADERLERLEASIARLEALGGPTPNPSAVNPDGTPGHVAPGELIESAWGNAVSDTFTAHSVTLSNHQDQLTGHYNEFQRRHAWLATNNSPLTVPEGSRIDYPGLTVTVPFAAGRIYRASAYVPFIMPTLSALSSLYISTGAGVVIAASVQFVEDGDTHTHYVSVLNIGSFATTTLKVQIGRSAGSEQVQGGADLQAYILVEELSLGTA